MSKKTKFGNSEALIINDLDLKNEIIDYLFNSLSLSKYRYVMLNNLQRLKFLKQNPHYVSPNFRGYNYLIIFMQIKGKCYCVAIDRKKLSYHKKNLDIKRVFLVRVRVKVSNSIFRGTILDCKLIRKNHEYFMLIKDCFKLMGQNLLDMEMSQKMSHLNSIINNHFNDNNCDNFIFKINKLYKYNQLEDVVKNIIPECSLVVHGLVFYPNFSGITVVHLENKQDKTDIYSSNLNVKNDSYNMITSLVEFLKNRKYSYELKGKKKKFWLKKTNITDVYDLYEEIDKERVGIAHIPNLKISHLCQKFIKEKPLKFLCIYNDKFKKWLPLSITNN